jgi:DNA-binding protein HU-beta
MNKAELVEAIAKKTNSTKADSESWLNEFLTIVSEEIKRGEVRLSGFGTFTTTERMARNGINPQTGQRIRIPSCRVPKFRPATELKKLLK